MKLFHRVVALFPILFCCFSLASASPACPGLFELKQPSGFGFRAKYAPGSDEHYHSIQTEDGYGIYKDKKEGWKYFLQKENRGKKWGVKKDKNSIRPVVGEVNPLDLGIPKGLKPKTKPLSNFSEGFTTVPKKISGDIKVVVIGVYFKNQSYTYSADEVRDVVFGDGNSMRNYFQKVSYGKIDIVPAEETSGVANDGFVGWIYLDREHPGSNFDYAILKQVLQQSKEFINLADFDKNGDSVLEEDELNIIFIVAGYEEGFGTQDNSTWAHVESTGLDYYDGVKSIIFALVGEIHSDHLLTIGVIAHEFGHLGLVLPDLYDSDSTGEDDWWGGLGYFCLMASGIWGKKGDEELGESPVHLSAWCKEQLGWGNLAIVNGEKNISLNRENSNDFNIARINTQKQEEYFLVELRRDEGFGINGNEIDGGAVIYHVNTNKIFPWFININNDPNDKGIDVEEASSSETEPSLDEEEGIYESMFYKRGYDFTNETDPSSKLNNGESTFVSITDFSEVADTMEFSLGVIYITPIPTPIEEKEMILSVTINEVKATNDEIIISKGSWVRVSASAFSWYDEYEELMENLQVDKVTCQIKNGKGKTKYYEEKQNSYAGNFAFKPKKRGRFEVEVVAYKTGYKTASFQAKFKVE